MRRQLSLVEDFTTTATRIARTIIDEVHLPLRAKTFKPRDFGGIAGTRRPHPSCASDARNRFAVSFIAVRARAFEK
jgi:hypothetical protein